MKARAPRQSRRFIISDAAPTGGRWWIPRRSQPQIDARITVGVRCWTLDPMATNPHCGFAGVARARRKVADRKAGSDRRRRIILTAPSLPKAITAIPAVGVGHRSVIAQRSIASRRNRQQCVTPRLNSREVAERGGQRETMAATAKLGSKVVGVRERTD